jgi:DNA-binding transcriptional ArsR family regulator
MESIIETASKLKALADPVKLEIVGRLYGSEKTVEELSLELSIPQSTLRKYLNELEESGYVERHGGVKSKYITKSFEVRLNPHMISEAVLLSRSALTPLIVEEKGRRIIEKLKSIGPKVREGKLSVYDAAQMLGVTYIEAYSLLEENRFLK